MDLAETFLEAAGQPIPDRMQGRSLQPIFQGATPADWRTAFYYHYYEYPADHNVLPHYDVITDRYTLAHFYKPAAFNPDQAAIAALPNDYWELFDREKDAGERDSVFGDPAYAAVKTNLMHEVFRLRTELKEPAQDDPKAFGRATEF